MRSARTSSHPRRTPSPLGHTKGRPEDPAGLFAVAAGAQALYGQFVRLPWIPRALADAGAVWHIEEVEPVLEAMEDWVAGRMAHAHDGVGMTEREVGELRALHEGAVVIMGGGARFEVAFADGVEQVDILRMEAYGKRDGGDGGRHAPRKERTGVFRGMQPLALFITSYMRGGATVRRCCCATAAASSFARCVCAAASWA